MRHQPYLSLVEQAISSERLRPYRRSPQEADVAVHARYLWNVALSEALYPPLQALEVALRNGIHAAATGAFGSATWFHQRLSDQVPVLQPDQRAQVARTTIDLTRRLAPRGRVATPETSSRASRSASGRRCSAVGTRDRTSSGPDSWRRCFPSSRGACAPGEPWPADLTRSENCATGRSITSRSGTAATLRASTRQSSKRSAGSAHPSSKRPGCTIASRPFTDSDLRRTRP